MASIIQSLGDWFFASAQSLPNREALSVSGETYTYDELATAAASVSVAIECGFQNGPGDLVALYAHRSLGAYAAILGILGSGRGYVPLNPRFPVDRTLKMLEACGSRTLVVDRSHLASFFVLLDRVPGALNIVAFDAETADVLSVRSNGHKVVRTEPMTDKRGKHDVSEEGLAYLLFTSGTTGRPKGVPITHSNVNHYIRAVLERYHPMPEDRFSQVFDLTFDLSVHDMFLCWAAGATLHVPSNSAVMAPSKFIQKNCLTFWFSVPSVIPIMTKFQKLSLGVFPTLKTSLFCGEALPVASVASWQAAAPNSIIENLYGPTEATIAFTYFRWLPEYVNRSFEAGLVPIGQPFPGLDCLILDEFGRSVSDGEFGELALGGLQLSPGYWRDAVLTADRFIVLDDGDGRPRRWYRTGDLARHDPAVGYVFLGRVDSQVKVMGYRVELTEIENTVRNAAGTDLVVAVPWPRNEGGGASGVIAFVCGSKIDGEAIIRTCDAELAPYMIPNAVYCMESFPLNANGKVDRGALVRLLEEGNV